MKKYIFAYTISGEGYSEPEFKIFHDKDIAEGYLSEKLAQIEQGSDGTVKRNGINDFIVTVGEEDDEDYHRLRIISVPNAKYQLIEYTEPNELAFILGTNDEELAKSELKKLIKKTKWDKNEEKWDGESNSFGAHAKDGYVHYEILTVEEDFDANAVNSKFPNGFTSWMETHHEVVTAIAEALTAEELDEEIQNRATRINEEQGTGGIYELGEELTDKFENLHKGREWDGDFFDEITEFLRTELNS